MRFLAVCLICFLGVLTTHAAVAQEMEPEPVYSSDAAQKPSEKMPVVIYGREACGWTQKYMKDLTREGVPYTFKSVDDDNVSHDLSKRMTKQGIGGRSYGLPVVETNGKLSIRPEMKKVVQEYNEK